MQPDAPVCGLAASGLTELRLAHIVELYDRATGSDAAGRWPGYGPQLDNVVAQLHSGRLWECRFGYPGNANAKLVIRLVSQSLLRIEIDTNDDGPAGYPEASRHIRAVFQRLLEQYLTQHGISAALPSGR